MATLNELWHRLFTPQDFSDLLLATTVSALVLLPVAYVLLGTFTEALGSIVIGAMLALVAGAVRFQRRVP